MSLDYHSVTCFSVEIRLFQNEFLNSRTSRWVLFFFVWWAFGFVLFFVLVFPSMMQTLSTCFLNQCVEDH